MRVSIVFNFLSLQAWRKTLENRTQGVQKRCPPSLPHHIPYSPYDRNLLLAALSFGCRRALMLFQRSCDLSPWFLSDKTPPLEPPAAYRWGGISNSSQDICPWPPAGMGNLSVNLLQICKRQIPESMRWGTQGHKVPWLKGGCRSIHKLNSMWEGLCVLAHTHAVHGRIVMEQLQLLVEGEDGLTWQDLHCFPQTSRVVLDQHWRQIRYQTFTKNRGVSFLNDDSSLSLSTSRWLFW